MQTVFIILKLGVTQIMRSWDSREKVSQRDLKALKKRILIMYLKIILLKKKMTYWDCMLKMWKERYIQAWDF